jgi:hypothetical protein
MRSAVFWVIAQLAVVNTYRGFEKTHRSRPQASRNSSTTNVFLDFSSLEEGIDVLSRNVRKELPQYAA